MTFSRELKLNLRETQDLHSIILGDRLQTNKLKNI